MAGTLLVRTRDFGTYEESLMLSITPRDMERERRESWSLRKSLDREREGDAFRGETEGGRERLLIGLFGSPLPLLLIRLRLGSREGFLEEDFFMSLRGDSFLRGGDSFFFGDTLREPFAEANFFLTGGGDTELSLRASIFFTLLFVLRFGDGVREGLRERERSRPREGLRLSALPALAAGFFAGGSSFVRFGEISRCESSSDSTRVFDTDRERTLVPFFFFFFLTFADLSSARGGDASDSELALDLCKVEGRSRFGVVSVSESDGTSFGGSSSLLRGGDGVPGREGGAELIFLRVREETRREERDPARNSCTAAESWEP